jgi:hypothetical protein
MRTKSIVLTAALVAAGAATSMAQVYSLNIVGYINVPIVPGYQMISCPLVSSPDNTFNTLFGTSLAAQTQLIKWNPSTSQFAVTSFNHGAYASNGGTNTLNPGEGCFINWPVAAGTTNFTFVGQVLSATSTGGSLSNSVVAGYQIISPLIPVAGDIQTNLQYTPNNLDKVFQWNNASSTYTTYSYNHNAWSGGNVPTNAPGQSFFLDAASAQSWVETNNFTGQ